MGESTTHARFVISKPDVISSPTIDTKDVNLDILNGNKPKDNGQAYKKIEAPDQLALYAEDFQQKGKLQKLLQNVGSYSAVIPTSEKNNEIAVLGTLAGVYLPCIQNIFGVILFIRLSWIVGTAGVLEAFAIVLICCCCTMLTAISMSAIATNGKVPAGGSYFMISRSLGPEFGGAVGILFYLGTSFASAMYILGAVEIMLTYIIPEMTLFVDNEHSMLDNMRVYGSALVLLMGGLVFVGVKYVNKCASLFLACVLLSILAIFVGFFSIHARDSPSVCYLGERLLASTSYSGCSKNDTMLKSLYTGGSTEQSHFFNVSSVRSEFAVPGLSKIFLDQIFSHYLSTGEVRKGVAGFAGEVTADATVSFTILLAIFFPSVTGIMAGSNRSGNLRNAQASIPKGTIAAVITTSSVYLASVIFMGATINGDILRDKFGKSIEGSLVVSTLAWPTKWAVLIGSLLSTIGAGLQSLTGAPRLLQAIAKDDIIPFLSVFAPVSRDGEPKRALLLTLLISEIGVLIASLDSVAPIITMFFLMCYGFINFACTLQSLLRLPNWRPRFHFYHWSLSLCGVLLCLFLMFISSWYYAIVACVIASFLYKYIEFRGAEKEWGDGFSGLALSAARYGLMRLENAPLHTKNWRPQILLLCSAESKENLLTEHSKKVISFSSQLKAGKGLTIVGSVIPGEFLDLVTERDELEEELNELMKTEKVKGFYTVACQPIIRDGFSQLIQTAGLGGLRPNTVMLGWPGNWKEDSNWHSFINCVRTVSDQKHALMVVKNPHLFPDRTDREQGHIDIWWIVHDGGLMLLLAFLLIRHKVWKKCLIRIFAVAQLTDNSVQMKKNLEELVYNLRLKADIEVIEMEDCDISAYTYERTLKAEQRKEMVARMRLSRRQSKREAQVILDSSHIPTSQDRLYQENLEPPVMSPRTDQQPEESNVRRMNTSLKLNSLISQRSNQSKLVLINLPMPPHALSKQIVYMEFVEALTEGIGRVLLIRGSGEEVVTIYS